MIPGMSTDWDDAVEAKYVVFKTDEFARWVEAPEPEARVQEVSDAVVIRLKDPFAATALFTYANTIMSTLELVPDLDPEVHQRMLDIADYFHERACESQSIKHKRLPD
jgi:hypothetical protein